MSYRFMQRNWPVLVDLTKNRSGLSLIVRDQQSRIRQSRAQNGQRLLERLRKRDFS